MVYNCVICPSGTVAILSRTFPGGAAQIIRVPVTALQPLFLPLPRRVRRFSLQCIWDAHDSLRGRVPPPVRLVAVKTKLEAKP